MEETQDISNVTHFPYQKLSDSKKTEDWLKQNVDGGEQIALYGINSGIRNTISEKQTLFNMYNGIIDERDMKSLINPTNIDANYFPEKITHYCIGNPKIARLVGEEWERKFDWKLVSTNPDAISEKEKQETQTYFNAIAEYITSQNYDEQTLQKKLGDLQGYSKYTIQDFREIMGTQALTYLFRDQDMRLKFNNGFKNALICGEEGYCCDISNGNPIAYLLNPINIFPLRMGDSPFYEDADIIIDYGYYSFGQIIDEYYDYLTSTQIDDLEKGSQVTNGTAGLLNYDFGGMINAPVMKWDEISSTLGIVTDQNVNRIFGGGYDEYGNIKRVRVVWRSLRKIGVLKYIDKDGQEQEKIVPEQYKIDITKGEKVEWKWINEWWEGTKLANDIYVKMQPRPIQFRSTTNLSECKSGYVGTIYNTNRSKCDSLMNRLKPYSYMYDIYMHRVNELYAKNPGVFGLLDITKKPKNMNTEQWLYYAYKTGFLFEDPFNEGKKGAATGMLSANVSGRGLTMDMSAISSTISSHFEMLKYLEYQMGKISGVNDQREGEIGNRETASGIQTAIKNSAMVTEEWFLLHDNTKARVMETLLETAQVAWKDKKIKIPYIFDDMTQALFEFGGDDLRNADFNLFTNNASDDVQLFASLRQLTERGLEANKITFSQIMDLYKTSSVSALQRKFEKAEIETQTQQQQQFEQQIQVQQQQIQSNNAIKEQELQLQQYKIDADNETKIRVAQLNAVSKSDVAGMNNENTESPMEQADMSIKQLKHNADNFAKQTELRLKTIQELNKNNLKEKELQIKENIAKEKNETELKKAEISLAVAKENKNKSDTKKVNKK